VRLLFIGDIVGKPGRAALAALLPRLRRKKKLDCVVANGENAAGGFGIQPAQIEEMESCGVDIITSGNHIWDMKEMQGLIEKYPYLLRPANYPPGIAGTGSVLFRTPKGVELGVINLMGRLHLPPTDCPFRRALEEVKKLSSRTKLIFVDFHAELTSEKRAMGHHLSGMVSAVLGTHTHVQTADEEIIDGHTAYITDAGMTGPHDSVIGMQKDIIIKKFLDALPARFVLAKDDVRLCGVLIDVDEDTGAATSIERIQLSSAEEE